MRCSRAGSDPSLTLFHWDLPAALDDRGGWLNPDIADWFADYAGVVFRALDGRVQMWTTLNEPWVVADGGYLHGKLAPGHASLFEAPIASHNLLRAHAAAVRAYRAEGRARDRARGEPRAQVSRLRGNADDLRRDGAGRRLHEPPVPGPGLPRALSRGDAVRDLRRRLAGFPAQPRSTAIREPIDFLGVNYYTRSVTRDDPRALPVRARAGPAEAAHATPRPTGRSIRRG